MRATVTESAAGRAGLTKTGRAAPGSGDSPAAAPWYEGQWATLGAMYVFLPLGLFLMWRYRPWPLWVKVTNSLIGPVLSVVGGYVTGKYVWPHVI